MTWVGWELDRTEQNPHIVDTAVSPDRFQLVLPVKIPDWLDFFADFWGAEFLDRLPDVLVPKKESGLVIQGSICWMSIDLPCGDHDDIGFNFTSVVEKCTRFVEPLEFWTALDLDLTIDDHRAGPDI